MKGAHAREMTGVLVTRGGEGRGRVREREKEEQGGNLFLRTGSESEDEREGVGPREEHGREVEEHGFGGVVWFHSWPGPCFHSTDDYRVFPFS